MFLKIIVTLILSAADAIFYRMGGSGRYPRWVRPVGIGVTTLLATWMWCGFHWMLFVSAGASAGLSTTYFKKKGSDAKWWNWLLVGTVLSLAMLPYVFFTHHWIGFSLRSFVLGGLVCLWSTLIDSDVMEESGRGFFVTLTIPLLAI